MLQQLIRIGVMSLIALTLATEAAAQIHATGPRVRVVLTPKGPRISGPTHWPAGTVHISATSRVNDQEVALLHLRSGYSFADFLADGRKAHTRGPAARAAVRHLYANTIFDGGLDLFRGQSAEFTAALEPGTYYLGEMTDRPQLTPLHVSGPSTSATKSPRPTIDATDHGYRIGGLLHANGTITFVNSGRRPHRLNLMPIARGTTAAQLIAYIRKTSGRDNAAPPPFALPGPQLGTAELSPGQRMQFTYHLPAGTYAALDLDQDMSTGRPEALNGLASVLTLR